MSSIYAMVNVLDALKIHEYPEKVHHRNSNPIRTHSQSQSPLSMFPLMPLADTFPHYKKVKTYNSQRQQRSTKQKEI